MLLLSVCTLWAQSVGDPVRMEDPNAPQNTPRSISAIPEVFLNGSILCINYPLSTVTQVVIVNSMTGDEVLSEQYDATRQVIVNLSSLPEGTYELRVYAFGKWWWGEFEIEDE